MNESTNTFLMNKHQGGIALPKKKENHVSNYKHVESVHSCMKTEARGCCNCSNVCKSPQQLY